MKVLVTRKIPDIGIQILKDKGYQVIIGSQHKNLTEAELKKKGKGVDALLTLLTDNIDGRVLKAIGPQLKIVANYAVGYDNINLLDAKKHNVLVTNTPDVLTEAVAEHTVALLLGIVRRLAESDRYVRANKYKGWEVDLLVGGELRGKTLGIVGHGRIGCRVAEIMHNGFGMNIIYYDVVRNKKREVKCGIQYSSFKDLLKKADVVSLHVPLLPSTRGIIGAKELDSMKSNSYLINTSRGPIIKEASLVKALQKGLIQGAALDVFENEPKLAQGLTRLDNVLLTPHIASATKEAREKMAELAANNIIAALSDKKPNNLVEL